MLAVFKIENMIEIKNYNSCRNCIHASFSKKIQSLSPKLTVLDIVCENEDFAGFLDDWGSYTKVPLLFDVNRGDCWVDACSTITDCDGFKDIDTLYEKDNHCGYPAHSAMLIGIEDECSNFGATS